ncbi:response regulator [Algibacter sp. 2305UL17-15]|uniref:LytR/AlgR family response regulator transcription factor n=1 Tax=Algibacter sp. 2305UL17-15 TaxID=3231268 RepID=UPI00345A84F5
MDKVKILVVEDEIIIADNICDSLNDLGYEALEPAINYTEAIDVIENNYPDIAILDIQLSGKKTGIDLAKKINRDYKFPFIFLTSNSDLATINEAKKVLPNAFLVKPFSKEELFSSIEVALYNFSKKTGGVDNLEVIIKDALFVKDKGCFTKILFDDILYVQSAHVYAEIVLKDKSTHVVRVSLNDIINKLSANFVRVHRGFIVNTRYLQKINPTSLHINDTEIPIGKTYREAILNLINLL